MSSPAPATGGTVLGGPASRMRELVELSPSSIFVKDLDGRYLLVNREWSRVTGIPPERALGRTTAECWPAEAGAIGAHETALAKEGTLITEERLITADGPRDFVVVRCFLHDAEGRPNAIAGIATDITERKRVEAELAARDRLFETVMKASPDVITVIDRKGLVVRVSESLQRILGYESGGPSVREMTGLVHGEDLSRAQEAFKRVLDGSSDRVHMRVRVRHSDGRWIDMDASARVLLDDSGEFSGAVVVSRDVTARLAAQKRLRDARAAAEYASAAKSDFLSRMSHELRTPLNSVLGFAQLLEMDELAGAHADAVDHILAAGRHLLDLIDEVLDIARIESGHLRLTMLAVPIAEIVREAVDLTRALAGRTGVSMHVGIGEGFAVRADPQRLRQVLLNLLSNAVKYNHPGGRVDVTCEPAGPGRLRVSVADTGRGVRPEDVERVFEPFDRLGAEQSGPEGTGVGLSLSRQLVEHMGGKLGFTSVHKVGSTFFVELDEAVELAEAVELDSRAELD
ncbi:MAG TPA: PAS domain-containing sensor histidine kinase [Acidimicrobiales bacterium]|nr:PAS domain-containing sensor histidine kinase [Acidimicrobiales bacterium]